MRVSHVKFKTNRETANFVHEHAEVEVEVKEGEDPRLALDYAEFLVLQKLGKVDEAEVRKSAKLLKFLEAEPVRSTSTSSRVGRRK
jgi:hypothetical protein